MKTAQAERLLAWVVDCPWLMRALRVARSLGLRDWAIGAGSLRGLAWDRLHGRVSSGPPADVDLVFFDAYEARGDAVLRIELLRLCPELPWEPVNQARVHEWLAAAYGHPVTPLTSLDDAVASWPEICTAVAVRLEDDDRLRLIAPFGLEDLMACVVRRNADRVSAQTYAQRCASKRFDVHWPRVRVMPA